MAGGVQSLQLHARYFSYLTADDVLIASDGAGKRRFPTGADDVGGALTSSVMSRGFTGHEMLDDTDLVQMNGRIYDPSLGKFLSADPFIQDIYLGASLNRYSYVWNNPLSYTDPSGHFVGVWAAVKFAIKAYSIYKSVSSIIDNPKFFALSSILRATLPFGDVVADGLAAAISAGIDGAELEDMLKAGGMAAGNTFATQRLDGYVGEEDASRAYQAVAAKAVLGGATSKLGGGKFANGAASSSFHYAVGRPEIMGWFGENGKVVDANGEVVNADPNNYVANGRLTINVNGIRGNEGSLMEGLGREGGGALGFFNPPHENDGFVGGVADIWESAEQLFFPRRDALARDLAGLTNMLSQDVALTVNGHSQGGLIASNAAGYFGAKRGTTYNLYSPAGDKFRSRWSVNRTGSVGTINTPWGDIANLYTAWHNPTRLLSGAADVPLGMSIHNGNQPWGTGH